MAKKNNNNSVPVAEVTEAEEVEATIAETVEEVVEEIVEEVKEVFEAVSDLVEGIKVEVVNFYVRALNGITGKVIGKDDNGHTLIELENGSQASFKEENLQQVK